MSMIQALSLLKDVKPYKQGWRVQGVKIHCSARNSLIKTTQNQSTFECDDEFLNFPPFEKIENGTLNTNLLIDVIGQVFSLHEIQTVQVAGNDKKKVEFRLMDIKGQSIACSLWGKYAEQLEEHLQQTNNPNMVCMIRFAKIGFYRGDVQITNAFDSSLICFDPDLPECLALENNMSNDEFALALTDKKNDKRQMKDQIDDWNDVGIKPISEIIMATQVFCSIESIDTDWSWFIFGHVSRNMCNKRCLRIKSKEGGSLPPNDKPLFWCTTCRANTTSVTPQLVFSDDTSTCKLMLLDSVAKIIIEDPDILPQAITDLVGKSICFGLTLGSENVKNGSDIFLVSQVWSGDKILQIESNSEPVTHVSLTEKSEANSSEGSSTPFSKRKEKDQVDQTSTSKKLCTKVVKMEKIKDDELNV
ncbi:hypothetical protein Bca4012_074605 [Brassica carinata]|uniref:Replication protein A OB domain-containing protein n=1 Tax=Brassica carinata TaxID=52824 RepID=A0A8X7QLK9_BRACI|nr:hypothetical protein Bca52824_066876 [Brassica carinata]